MDFSTYLKNAAAGNQYRGHGHKVLLRQEDADLIDSYLVERVGFGLGGTTALTTAGYLTMVSRALSHPFTNMTTNEILKLTTRYNNELKQNTRRRLYPTLRGFLAWLHESGHNSAIDLEKVNKIKTPGLDSETKKASEMFTADQIKALIAACTSSRDRALVAMMFEGALRPIEITSARWEDLNFDRYGATFDTAKKTGKPRRIRLIWSAPYLLAWKNDYPEVKRDAPVFINKHYFGEKPHYRPITQSGIKTLFYQLQDRAGIPRRAPYFLRHSRITSLIADEVPESVVKMLAWGSLKSNMLATYAHLSNADVDRILLQRAGLKMEAKEAYDGIKPLQCTHCGGINRPTAKFCETCGLPLTEEARASLQTATVKVEGDPRFKMAFDAAMRALEAGPATHAPGASG